MLLVMAVVIRLFGGEAYALQKDIDAGATFVQGTALKKQDMEFGEIRAVKGAGENTVTLSAGNGRLSCSNTREYDCPANGGRGEVSVSGTAGQTVQLACQESATLTDGSARIYLENAQVSQGGKTHACRGMNQSVLAYTLTARENAFGLGGQLRLDGGSGGSFSTAASGGVPLSIRVIYP